MNRLAPLAALTAVGLALTGCGGSASAGDDGRLRVVAAFYPLAYAVEQVGGDRVTVATLTKPGGEPHDLELLPRQILDLQRADLTIYLSAFQPAVDAAIAAHGEASAFDVSTAAELIPYPESHAGESAQEHAAHASDDPAASAQSSGAHAGESEQEHAGHDHGADDPHFWLDPVRYTAVAEAIAGQLTAKDPAGAQVYEAGARTFAHTLAALDTDLRAGLATCLNREIVTGHTAFGYLAARYDLTEVSVSGLSPDVEPTASAMAHIVDFVREHGIRTVYSEAMTSPALTETLARETGARVLVLDPVEGITDESAGRDYVEVMRANLAHLRAGQECS